MPPRLVRLSATSLWRDQAAWFADRGVRAWNEAEVPHHITSNPWIASSYARVTAAWMEDGLAQGFIDPAAPLHIVEIGCGNGRFGWYFIRKLLELTSSPSLAHLDWRYTFTDSNDYNVDVLRSHPSLRPLIDDSRVSFSCFDAVVGRTLPVSNINPVIFLANYVFDGIPQDCFRVEDGRLFEGLLAEEQTVEQRRLSFTWSPANLPYYGNEIRDGILAEYTTALKDTTFLFPRAALDCLDNLSAISKSRFLLLSGDKGSSSLDSLRTARDPFLNVHGSFSLMVDYHAIALAVRQQGGEVLASSHRGSALAITATAMGTTFGNCPLAARAFEEFIEEQGPDDYHLIARTLRAHASSLTIEQIVAILRFSGWDHAQFLGYSPVLGERIPKADAADRNAVADAIYRVWDAYFPLREPGNVALAAAVLLLQLGRPRESLEFIARSRQLYAPGEESETVERLARAALEQLETPGGRHA